MNNPGKQELVEELSSDLVLGFFPGTPSAGRDKLDTYPFYAIFPCLNSFIANKNRSSSQSL
jgi:hypothetical protein